MEKLQKTGKEKEILDFKEINKRFHQTSNETR
jgi:hypothetical protein